MSKTAAFRYQGGKARIRRHLIELFPKAGGLYLEPFAGRGNVFFLARTLLQFRSWRLSDAATIPFLRALIDIDPETLPERVSREDFKLYAQSDSALAQVLEPRITFCGKGYRFGYSGDSGTHIGYRGESYAKTLRAAKEALTGVELSALTWDCLDLSGLGWGDFVYFDPPYYRSNSPYGNIDHKALIKDIADAPYKWALSGYRSELYLDYLGEPTLSLSRKAEMQNLNHSSSRDVEESLWVNYL